MEVASKLVSIDNFIERLQKTGFARIEMEIDSSLPLKPGVLIKGKVKTFL